MFKIKFGFVFFLYTFQMKNEEVTSLISPVSKNNEKGTILSILEYKTKSMLKKINLMLIR